MGSSACEHREPFNAWSTIALIFLLISFHHVNCQCSGGYTAVSGDISGWGAVNGIGMGQKVPTCRQCNILCDQQGAACLSTECSPTALKCNLNALRDPSSKSYKDYVFCKKPAGVYRTSCVPNTMMCIVECECHKHSIMK
jgi:hypothetical protein